MMMDKIADRYGYVTVVVDGVEFVYAYDSKRMVAGEITQDSIQLRDGDEVNDKDFSDFMSITEYMDYINDRFDSIWERNNA